MEDSELETGFKGLKSDFGNQNRNFKPLKLNSQTKNAILIT